MEDFCADGFRADGSLSRVPAAFRGSGWVQTAPPQHCTGCATPEWDPGRNSSASRSNHWSILAVHVRKHCSVLSSS